MRKVGSHRDRRACRPVDSAVTIQITQRKTADADQCGLRDGRQELGLLRRHEKGDFRKDVRAVGQADTWIDDGLDYEKNQSAVQQI